MRTPAALGWAVACWLVLFIFCACGAVVVNAFDPSPAASAPAR